MHLRVLGCSGGIGAGLRTTAYLLDDEILLDAGTGVGDLTFAEMRRIKHVFVTHSHLDHITSIPKIVDTLFGKLDTPLSIHALPETIQALKDHIFNWTIWPDFSALPDNDLPIMKYVPMNPGSVVKVEGKDIEILPVNHVVPGVALYISSGGKSLCFSGDTSINDTLWERLNEIGTLDLLLVECGFSNRDERLANMAKHYCPRLLAKDLGKLNLSPLVAIVHMKPGREDETMGEIRAEIQGRQLIRLKTGDILEV